MNNTEPARKPLLRRSGVSGPAHSGAFGGTGAPALRLLAPLALAAAFLALTASSASAARGHVFDPDLTIGTPCTAEPCGPGELKEPTAVAVNEATGNVYVVDQGNNHVQVFSSSGAPA